MRGCTVYVSFCIHQEDPGPGRYNLRRERSNSAPPTPRGCGFNSSTTRQTQAHLRKKVNSVPTGLKWNHLSRRARLVLDSMMSLAGRGDSQATAIAACSSLSPLVSPHVWTHPESYSSTRGSTQKATPTQPLLNPSDKNIVLPQIVQTWFHKILKISPLCTYINI